MCTECRMREIFVCAAGCGPVHVCRQCGAGGMQPVYIFRCQNLEPSVGAAGRRDSVSGMYIML